MLIDKYIDPITKLKLDEQSPIIKKFSNSEEKMIQKIKSIDETMVNLKKEKLTLQKKIKQNEIDFTNALTKKLFEKES